MKYITLLAMAVLAQSTAFAAEIHVAPNGSDTNPGKAEKPFATLEKARDTARATGGKNIVFVSGTIRLTKTFELNEKDSGTTFKGQADARICGSVAIPNAAVKPVTDKATLGRLVPEVRGKVLEIDLHALGIKDFGEIGPRGFRRPYIPAPLELFVDDEPLRIAQWPNPGQAGEPMGKVLDMGSVPRKGEKPTRGGIFTFKTDRPKRWTQAKEIWITGLFANGYADNTVKVKAFDLKEKTLSTIQPHMYGFVSGKPWNTWTALNLLEEIDQPGEFVADKVSGKLYFLPPKGVNLSKCRMEVSTHKEPMVAIEGVSGVVFDGINFENSRGMGVYIERGENNRIQNCTLRNLGIVAVCIGKGVKADTSYRHNFSGIPASRELGSWHEHIYDNTTFDREAGAGHGIINCHIYNIGAGAISLGGGDRVELIPAGNFVENCEIHHYNRWDRSYKAAVNFDGVGNRVSHCLIHDAPASAFYLHGNDHVMEYNEIHHVMMEGDDMGAFYMGRDLTERGYIIRYNYWHDLSPCNSTRGLYFDDWAGGPTTIHGNIFCRASKCATIFMNHGSGLTITNNIFIDCPGPLVVHDMADKYFLREQEVHEKRLRAVGYDRSPWKERYPDLLQYQDVIGPRSDEMPLRTLFARNLMVDCDKGRSCRWPKELKVTERDNHRIHGDPGFVDMAHGDFRLKPGTDLGIPGFQTIPFEKIGLKERPSFPHDAADAPPEAKLPKPTPQQLAWQEAELGVLFHTDPRIYNLDTVQNVRNICKTPLKNPAAYADKFNPTHLDTDQWIAAAKAMGAKYAILVAKHETGFCLWQSDANPYCLKSIKWRDGKGDIVRDFVASCRKYGLKPGLFTEARWNVQLGIYMHKVGKQSPLTQAQYNRLIEREVEELCTRYGDLFELWWDGGVLGPSSDGPNTLPIVKKNQPQAILYPTGGDHRWAGSESGIVLYPCWSTITPGSHVTRKLLGTGQPDGSTWSPAMADVTLRKHLWFWQPKTDHTVLPLNNLQEIYYSSVGRNANLIVGIVPDLSGLIPAPDVARCKEFGEWLADAFGGKPLVETTGHGAELALELPADAKGPVTHIILQEEIKNGERVREYVVEALIKGAWQQVGSGSCIGHKRIERIAPCDARKYRLRITRSIAEPEIRSFSIR